MYTLKQFGRGDGRQSRQIEEARRLVEVDEVATLLQLTLLSSDTEVGDVMNAREYLHYEMEFDLNNPYESTDEEFLDIGIPQNIKKPMLMRLWLMW